MRREDRNMSSHAVARPVHGRFRLAAISLLALAGVVVFAACGAGNDNAGTTGLEVPDLSISAYQGDDVLGGTEVTLSEVLDQGKPVVLNFWAALCPPCRAEMPDIQRIFEERGDEVTIVGIDIGPQQLLGSRDEGRLLLEELDVHYPAGTTFDDRVVLDFEIFGMPTTFFINADGSLLRSWSGLLNEAKINEFIDQMVAG